MNKFMSRACVALLASLALAACGGNAYAGSLTQNFKGDSGNVFQVANALSFKQTQGAVQVVAANGTTYTYPDVSGSLFVKLVNATTGFYVNVAGTAEYMNTVSPLYVMCYNGNQSAFAYVGPIPARFISDGCAAYNLAVQQSN